VIFLQLMQAWPRRNNGEETTAAIASIILVDDDPVVLRTTELVLRSAGHTTWSATNIADGIRLLKTHQCDLLLVDCIPDCGRLVEEARGINPALRIAACTGDGQQAESLPVDAVFHKPLTPPEFLRKIAELLA
jgi:CheY-like chemotaxis protein